MSAEADAPWLRLRDLAREQKAAVEAGKMDDAAALADRRRQLLLEIQNNDAPAGVRKPAVPEGVIREILAIDEGAVKVLKSGMREISCRLEKINTFKILCQGAIEGARSRRAASVP